MEPLSRANGKRGAHQQYVHYQTLRASDVYGMQERTQRPRAQTLDLPLVLSFEQIARLRALAAPGRHCLRSEMTAWVREVVIRALEEVPA